ncbi:MAG: PEP-CTERM-box response regulator transcription factor, partial [Proteobacteria bacterium]|nr:PEP-CTERM-box response regulator transcription factor [Pseudomonadota bacterium]
MAESNQSAGTLLIVEDDEGLQRQLRWCFEGYDIVTATDRASAIAALRRSEPAVVLQDLGLPPDPAGVAEGLECLREIVQLAPATNVIVMTGNGDRDNAVKAIGLGAWDFYQKPVDAAVLRIIVDRAFHVHHLEAEHRRRQQARSAEPLEGIVAVSPEMVALCRKIEKVAPTDASVLLLGESGTGKELLARAIHAHSPRRDKRFVAINCAAIPENLLESELFGYEKGAFTGAARTTPGKVEVADGGTLLLDEIGDMAPALQAKLLRFLQERVVERVGGRTEIPIDVRVVCATNQDLQALIAEGRFRADLYYRIGQVALRVPPLRERRECIAVIAQKILRHAAEQNRRPRLTFAPDAIAALEAYPWPGNVRELENRISTAVIMCDRQAITADDLGLAATDPGALLLNLRETRARAEAVAVKRALALAGGN